MDIERVLKEYRPGTSWSLNGNNYENLEWLDDSPKPRKSTLEAKWAEIEEEVKWDKVKETRNIILQNTLWIVSEDSPYSSDEILKWKKYRKKVSTITKAYTDPKDVVWPNEP